VIFLDLLGGWRLLEAELGFCFLFVCLERYNLFKHCEIPLLCEYINHHSPPPLSHAQVTGSTTTGTLSSSSIMDYHLIPHPSPGIMTIVRRVLHCFAGFILAKKNTTSTN
jgi:hypothetical protein